MWNNIEKKKIKDDFETDLDRKSLIFLTGLAF